VRKKVKLSFQLDGRRDASQKLPRCVSAIASSGRTVWIADAHCDNGKRFVVRADEKLTAFMALESAIRQLKSRRYRTAI